MAQKARNVRSIFFLVLEGEEKDFKPEMEEEESGRSDAAKRPRLLVPNDGTAPVRVHVDDLHPHSALRGVLVHDDVTSLDCGVQRDVLLSLVASYRYGRLVVKGGASRDEVALEVDRDRVSLRRSTTHPLEEKTALLADHLAAAIDAWPAMQRGMNSFFTGGRCDWDTGPLDCRLQFVPKRPLGRVGGRTFQLFVHYVFRALTSDCEGKAHDLKTFEAEMPLPELARAVGALDEANPFWFAKYDVGAFRTMSSRSVGHRLGEEFLARIVESSSRTDETTKDEAVRLSAWDEELLLWVRHVYERIPDIVRMVRPGTPSSGFFAESLAERHMFFEVDADDRRCVIFPTMWYDEMARRSGVRGALHIGRPSR